MPTGFKASEYSLAITARTGRNVWLTNEAGKGQVRMTQQWTDKLPHPTNMEKYDTLCNDPETRIGLDLLSAMTVGGGMYCQMPETDEDGNDVKPDHPNKKKCEDWLKKVKADEKFKEIERTKLGKGFCPVEILDDGGFKVLPPETFYIWNDKKGNFLKYTQEILGESNPLEWKQDEIALFIQDEDTTHPYGHAIVDSIAELIEARQSMNRDMPKIFHRFASPLGVWEADRDISQVYASVIGRDVNEEIFLSNVPKDTLRHTYYEPQAQGKFQNYIEQINFQIAENLHAPLILLLRNANLASSKIMMDSVELFTRAEQNYNSSKYQELFFTPLCGSGPIPLLKWGAPKAIFDDITLADIKALAGQAPVITPSQAQDLVKQKGIPLIEPTADELNPKTPPMPQPGQPGKPFQFQPGTQPTNLVEPQKITQLQASLSIVRDGFHHKQISLSEAIREGSQIITAAIERMKHEALIQMNRILEKPIVSLSPESTRMFELIRCEMFDQYRESLLPTGLKGAKPSVESYTIIPNSS